MISTRRRFLTITAAAGASLTLGGRSAPLAARPDHLHQWHGFVLGAEARILLYHPERGQAQRLIRAAIAEIARLERIFSLHRPDSALSRLNRDSVLADPPEDLRTLLRISRRVSEATDGAFDPTVQPLWRLFAGHFSRPGADPAGPPPDAIAAARARVDFRKVTIGPHAIRLTSPGAEITLNGIAQGYITDRIADLLRRGGVDHVLVDLGETRTLGHHPDGRRWRIGLTDPRDPARVFRAVELADQALATSGGYGTPFDAAGRHHHLFDPRTGRSSNRYLSVSVLARRATLADALSTAFAAMSEARIDASLKRFAPAQAIIVRRDGAISTRRAAA